MARDSDGPSALALPRGTLTARAVDRLRELIADGHLPLGGRIPEHSLCERFGLSRTPLREALKVLAAEGLVLIAPNKGAVVARPSLDDVEHTLEVLIALEGHAAELAASRISDEQIGAVERLHATMVEHFEAGRLMDYFRVNQAIHQAIVEASRNPRLARIYQAESARIHRYRYAGNEDPDRWQRAVREHEQILDVLRERDSDLLPVLMRSHLRNGWRVARARAAAELDAAPAELSPANVGA